MKLLQCTPGTGSFFCGSCIRDNALVRALRQAGHEVTLAPLYLPLVTDDTGAETDTPVFFGGVNVYLQQKSALFRNLPGFVDRLFDSRWMLNQAAKRAGMTRASELGELTISMLRGEEGRQAKELARMIDWLQDRRGAEAVCLSNALLLGLARRLKHNLGLPVACTLQGEDTFLDALNEPFRSQAWAVLAERAREVDRFIAVSEYYGRTMQQRLNLRAEQVCVVPNGIALTGYDAASTSPTTSSTPRIGYLARLHPCKGLRTLLEAFILLKAQPDLATAELRIAGSMTTGDEPFLAELRARIHQAGVESAVQVLPNLDRAAKIAFLQSVTVFSVPATYGESFGLYVLEALAAGVPVVQPKHAAFPELLQATGGGLLVEPDSPQALADGLAQLLRDRTRARALGEAGRQAVRERFSVERMAADVARVLQGMIDASAVGKAGTTGTAGKG